MILNQTIFYPQGGGQPCDQGTIDVEGQVIPIHTVRWDGEEVRHYTNQDCSSLIGKQAKLAIDQERRSLNTRFHTAGHVLSQAVETIAPHWTACKGHHYPENAYVEFSCQDGNANAVDLDAVNAEIEKLITQNDPISAHIVSREEFKKLCPAASDPASSNQPIRIVCFGESPYQPCGGTHVKSLGELAGLTASKQKLKGAVMRISYRLAFS